MVLRTNKWVPLNVVVTSHLIAMTQKTLRTARNVFRNVCDRVPAANTKRNSANTRVSFHYNQRVLCKFKLGWNDYHPVVLLHSLLVVQTDPPFILNRTQHQPLQVYLTSYFLQLSRLFVPFTRHNSSIYFHISLLIFILLPFLQMLFNFTSSLYPLKQMQDMDHTE